MRELTLFEIEEVSGANFGMAVVTGAATGAVIGLQVGGLFGAFIGAGIGALGGGALYLGAEAIIGNFGCWN